MLLERRNRGEWRLASMTQERRIKEFHEARFVDLITREKGDKSDFHVSEIKKGGEGEKKRKRKTETNLNPSVFDEHLNEPVDRDEEIGVEGVPMFLILDTIGLKVGRDEVHVKMSVFLQRRR